MLLLEPLKTKIVKNYLKSHKIDLYFILIFLDRQLHDLADIWICRKLKPLQNYLNLAK